MTKIDIRVDGIAAIVSNKEISLSCFVSRVR